METAEVIPFPGAETADPHIEAPESRLDVSDLSRPLCQLNVFRIREQSWMPHLTDIENRLLGLILRKTVGWQKTTETFTLTYLAQGIARDKQTVRRALRSLAALRGERGAALIAVHEAPNPNDGFLVTINVHWKPKPMPLAIPKRPRPVQGGISGDTPRGISRDTSPRISGDTQTETPLSHTSSDTHSSGPAARPLLAIPKRSGKEERESDHLPATGSAADPSVHAGSARGSAPGFKQADLPLGRVNAAEQAVKARQTASAQARREEATPGALEATWRLAWAEKHAGMPGARAPGWTKEEKGIVKNTLLTLPLSAPELHDMIEWVVRDYDAVIGTHFRWMTKSPPPAMPVIRFIAAHAKSFWTAWVRQQQAGYVQGLDDADRREYLRLTRDARMTHEEAVAEVTRQKVLRGEFEALEREKAEVARQRRIAEMTARQTPAFSPAAPHPASIAAVRQRQGGAGMSLDEADALVAGLKWGGR